MQEIFVKLIDTHIIIKYKHQPNEKNCMMLIISGTCIFASLCVYFFLVLYFQWYHTGTGLILRLEIMWEIVLLEVLISLKVLLLK